LGETTDATFLGIGKGVKPRSQFCHNPSCVFLVCTFFGEAFQCKKCTLKVQSTCLLSTVERHAKCAVPRWSDRGKMFKRFTDSVRCALTFSRVCRGTHVTRHGGESAACISPNVEKVPSTLNLPRRVCVLSRDSKFVLRWYSPHTEYRFQNFRPRFCKKTARTCKYGGFGPPLKWNLLVPSRHFHFPNFTGSALLVFHDMGLLTCILLENKVYIHK
jgi:hypothetical protein